MSIDKFTIDIHCHNTMRAWHNFSPSNPSNLWEKNLNEVIDTKIGKFAINQSKGIAKYSQSNIYSCINGGVRVLLDSLYPLERGFINSESFSGKIIGKQGAKALVINATGLSEYRYDAYKENEDYFQELCDQYDFLVSAQGKSPCTDFAYKVVNNYEDLSEWLSQDKNNLAVIVTIEGAHVFGCGLESSMNMNPKKLETTLLQNIKKVKEWDYPPFFITFAHHFWNQLCGHASTLPRTTKLFCNQQKGLNTGFTSLGKNVLKELLSTKNGKRMLIDIRHMSIQARLEYYSFVKKHNSQNPEDLIPIISSHTAVNGFDTILQSIEKKDNAQKVHSSEFFSWSINLSKEEIVIIHESNGIIGVILDKGRHGGAKKLKKINSIKNKSIQKQAYLQLILENVFFYIEAVGKKTAWDMLTLGTDFDGVITHFDAYDSMDKIGDLKVDLTDCLEASKFKREYWFDYKPKELLDKIFHSNANEFLKTYFT
mgnify:CR=1 FL=1